MNKAWINYEHTSAVSAIEETYMGNHNQQEFKKYILIVHLLGGQTLTFNFKDEADQIDAYEKYKPK